MGNPNIKNYGFGSPGRTKEFDDAAREKSKTPTRKRVWTKEKCINELEDCLTLFKKILRDDKKLNLNNPIKLKAESVRDLNNMMNRMLQYMQYLYPPTTSNVNLNIDVTTDAVMERLKAFKEEQVLEIVAPKEKEEIKNGNK